MPRLSPPELRIIRSMLISEFGPSIPLLDMIELLSFDTRHMTGTGYYVTFANAKQLPFLDRLNTELSKDLQTSLPAPADLAAFTLFIRHGYLSSFEGYTFGDVRWPEEPMEDWLIFDTAKEALLMDNLVILRTTLLALQETVRTVAGNWSKPSSAIVGQVNSVFSEINKIVPGAHFAKFDSHPDPVEVLPQIKLALDILEKHNSTSTTDQAAAAEPALAQASEPARKPRPQIFIGCSVEGLTEAKLIQLELAHSADPVIWSQGVFGLSRGTLETLVEKARSFTHAVLVLTPDDMLIKRESEVTAARDNVLFELGLFMGALGRERTFVVAEKSVRLPTDLAGISIVSYQRGEGANLVANIGPVVTKLQLEMGLL